MDLYPSKVKLLKAQKTRESLLEVCTPPCITWILIEFVVQMLRRAGREHRIQIDNNAMLDALDRDDMDIAQILKTTLQSHGEQMQLRALGREDTQLVLDIIQTVCIHVYPFAPS
jgi:DNA-binding transcriptional LysR family regulator